jgi:hypothetical protein
MSRSSARAVTPDLLAAELGVTGKAVRAFLRDKHSRPRSEWHCHWRLDAALADLVRRRFAARHRAVSRAGMIVLTIALSPSSHAQLTRIAKHQHVATVELLRKIVDDWLGRPANNALPRS